jgi:hypothetical protein
MKAKIETVSLARRYFFQHSMRSRHPGELRALFPANVNALLVWVRSVSRIDPQIGNGDQRLAIEEQRQAITPPRQDIGFLEQLFQLATMGMTRQLDALPTHAMGNSQRGRKLCATQTGPVSDFRTD